MPQTEKNALLHANYGQHNHQGPQLLPKKRSIPEHTGNLHSSANMPPQMLPQVRNKSFPCGLQKDSLKSSALKPLNVPKPPAVNKESSNKYKHTLKKRSRTPSGRRESSADDQQSSLKQPSFVGMHNTHSTKVTPPPSVQCGNHNENGVHRNQQQNNLISCGTCPRNVVSHQLQRTLPENQTKCNSPHPSNPAIRRQGIWGGRNSEPRSMPQYFQMDNSCMQTSQVALPHQSGSAQPQYTSRESSFNQVTASQLASGCSLGTTTTPAHLTCSQLPSPTQVHSPQLCYASQSVYQGPSTHRSPCITTTNRRIPSCFEHSSVRETSLLTPRSTSYPATRLPPKQTSMDEISSLTQPHFNPDSGISPSKLTTLTNSNSAASSLSTADEKTYIDSGISSSSYSKDSVCTSPMEAPIQTQKGLKEYAVSSQGGSGNTAKPLISNLSVDNNRSMSASHNESDHSERQSYFRAKSTEPAILIGNRFRVPESSSQMQPSISQSNQSVNHAHSQISEQSKLISRQRARELYNLVKSREEPKQLHFGNRLYKVYSEEGQLLAGVKPPSVTSPTRPQTLTMQANVGLTQANTHCSYKQLDHPTYEKPPQNISRCPSVVNTCTGNEIPRHPEEYKQPQWGDSSANSRLHTSSFQLSLRESHTTEVPLHNSLVYTLNCQPLQDNSTISNDGHLPEDQSSLMRHLDNANNPNLEAELLNHSRTQINPSSIITSTSTTTTSISGTLSAMPSTLNPEKIPSKCPFVPSSKDNDDTSKREACGLGTDCSDPEELLSSLSKLTLDANDKSNFWDEKYCFSDVESEYAALELLIPFANSLGEPCTLKKRTNSSGPPLRPRTTSEHQPITKPSELSPMDNESTHSNEIFSRPRPSTALGDFIDRRSKDHPFNHPSANGRLPVASVAPIMATGRQIRASSTSLGSVSAREIRKTATVGSNGTEQLVNKVDREFNEQLLQGPDGLFCPENSRWARLKGMQGSIPVISGEKLTRGNGLTGSLDMSLHKPNLLDHVKLPYPKATLLPHPSPTADSPGHAVRLSLSNYALQQNNCGLSENGIHQCAGEATADDTVQYAESVSSGCSLGHHQKQVESLFPQQEVERLRQELQRSNDQISALTAQLSRKVHGEATLDEARTNLTSKIQQLTTLNTIKDSEIYELRNTINQLRSDMHRLQLLHETRQLRPGRSNSYRALPENSNQQDIQETISLNSLASGTSNGSQDTSSAVGPSGSDSTATLNSAQSPDASEHSAGKRSRWIRPTLGKAFKKRSKSSMDTGDRDSTRNDPLRLTNSPTATVFTNLPAARIPLPLPDGRKRGSPDPLKIVSSQQTGDQAMHDLLLKMRWELSCLEADNQRLRRLVLKNPSMSDVQTTGNGEVTQTISLTDLSMRYCSNAKQCVQVYIHPEPTPGRECPQPTEEFRLWDVESRTTLAKLLKAGCVGLREGSTWQDLDNSISALVNDYMLFLDPEQKLGLQPLSTDAYQLGYRVNGITPTGSSVVMRRRTGRTSTEFVFLCPQQYIENQEPLVWLGEVLHVENEKTILLHAIVSLIVVEERTNPMSPGEIIGSNNHRSDAFSLLSFETLIPVQSLRHYLSVVQNNQISILCGPPGTGKLRILRELARHLLESCRIESSVKTYSIKPGGSGSLDEIKKFFSSFTSDGQYLAILENLHHFTGPLQDLLNVIGGKEQESRPIILATSDVHNEELDSLQDKKLAGIIAHLTDLEATTDFLGCYLRRKLAQARLFEVTPSQTNIIVSSHEDQALTHLVNWMPKVWHHLNRLFVTPQEKQRSNLFGLRVFLTCPMDLQSSQNWFTDLWNNLFIPFLFRTRSKDQVLSTSTTTTLSASFDWIMATWPWSRTNGTQELIGTEKHEIGEPTSLVGTQPLTAAQTSPLVTFGVPKSPQVPVQRQRMLKNRSSLDSGIVPDGYAAGTASGSMQVPFESRSSVGSEVSDGLTVTELLTEVTSKSCYDAIHTRELMQSQIHHRV